MIEIGYLSNDIANSKLKLKTDKQSKKLLSPNNFEFTKNYFFNKIKIIKSQFTQNTRRPSLFFFSVHPQHKHKIKRGRTLTPLTPTAHFILRLHSFEISPHHHTRTPRASHCCIFNRSKDPSSICLSLPRKRHSFIISKH